MVLSANVKTFEHFSDFYYLNI
ncbi:hypothetical protein OOU_Y34scaffold00874g1 [Pyricularia oryzae Y34]|uniref:Uncharacterized protein n=1 Tax=Pyricularia oryzae (strain Y34) TaxID=1143189 RepID=A0AA97NPB1_PYRO3|nr:hypothetical protein OOU_Y34scaffold00874g1 [Pyricularia oryzae Y34]